MNNRTSDDLKPCAQCDAEAVLITQSGAADGAQNYWKGYVKCNRPSCGMRTPSKTNPEAAKRIWNREPED